MISRFSTLSINAISIKAVVFSVLFVAVSFTSSLAQTYPPAMDYAAMMDIRFYDATGGFLIETLPVFFPPSDAEQLEFEIATAGGDVKFSKSVKVLPYQQLPVVDGIRPKGNGSVSGLPPGDYVFCVKAGAEEITRVAFTMVAGKSDDPFNPQTKFTREGPWSALGYLASNAENPEEALQFHWWSRVAELPGGQGGKVEVQMMKEGQVLADTKGFFVSKDIWQSCAKPLRKAGSGGREFFTMADLCSEDGDYRVIVKSGDTIIRTYLASVNGGELQHHPRSAMGYEPKAEYITPKVVTGSAGNGSGRQMIDAYWMDAQ